jgi:hypothetical protein
MRFQPKSIYAMTMALALVGATSCSRDSVQNTLAPGTENARLAATASAIQSITLPFNADNFKNGVANIYFPLAPGTKWAYRQETPEGVETNPVEVTRDSKTILGVKVTVVHDQVYLGGSLKENTFDWYAADKNGNVWYFGEDTKTIENGAVVSTEGSWEAGKNGAKAGIVMLAHPEVGDVYQQENSPGIVADMARVKALNETVVTPYGTLTDCLKTQEFTSIEPGSRAFKFYGRGIGIVMEDENKNGGPVVLTSFSTP